MSSTSSSDPSSAAAREAGRQRAMESEGERPRSSSTSGSASEIKPATTIVSSIKVMPRSNSLSRMEIQIESAEQQQQQQQQRNQQQPPPPPVKTHHLEHIEGTVLNPLAYRREFSGGDLAEMQREEMIKKIVAEKQKATANT